jgi:hypothetical protein
LISVAEVTNREIQLELKHTRLERLVGLAWPASLGPVRDDLSRATGTVRDFAIQRLDRKTAEGVSGHERVKPASQPVDLDNVARLDALESHPELQVTELPSATGELPSATGEVARLDR